MQSLKKALLLLLITACLAGANYWWTVFRHQKSFNQADFFSSAEALASKQFCNVIFPKIESCLTLNGLSCDLLVTEPFASCTEQKAAIFPNIISDHKFSSFYVELMECFEPEIKKHIIKNYIKNTKECIKIFE